MTTEAQREWQERVETLRNDARLRQQQTSTLHQHAQAQADELSQGRFRATGTPSVTGTTAIPSYPPGPQWSAGDQGVEPALGYAIDDAPVVGEPHEVAASLERLGETGATCGPPDGGAAEDPASVFPASSDAAEPAASPTPSEEKSED